MALSDYDSFIARIAAGYWANEPFYDEVVAATASGFTVSSLAPAFVAQRCGWVKTLPSPLPSGVTAYVPTRFEITSSASRLMGLLAKMVNLGSLTLGDGAGGASSFADGSAMPTVTELGVSRQVAGAVLAEVTTALNSAPGTFTVTYVDQDGNTAEATAAHTPVNSSAVQTAGDIGLNAGDWGVQDITTAARSGGTNPSGVIKFWGIIPISLLPITPLGAGFTFDNLLTVQFNPIRLGAGDQLGAFIFSSTVTKSVVGRCFFVGDS